MWFKYPKDSNTFAIDHQFFYGDSILVSPVTQENAISVSIYLPKDTFYDFKTLSPVEGTGSVVTLDNVDLTQIPIHIKGGVVLPLRVESAMTTTALRTKDFELIVAPNSMGEASGQLYSDDGESLLQNLSTLAKFKFNDRKLIVSGQFNYPLEVKISRLRILNVQETPRQVYIDQKPTQSYHHDQSSKVLDVTIGRPFTGGFEVHYS
jgi:alpha-glucosidase